MFFVRRWTSQGAFHDIDFSARAGEIVALMGVEGSGARELLRSFAGLERTTGDIALAGATNIDLRRLRAYVPATRALSLYSNFSVGENLLVRLGVPDIAGPLLALKKSRMAAIAQQSVRRFLVKTSTTTQPIRSLSGGNQQKVAIARWLAAGFRVLLCFDPTRGIDVGTKRQIYSLLREVAQQGASVLLFTSELPEIRLACDRAIVLFGGRISGEMPADDADEARLLRAAHGLIAADAEATA
jgi:ABC-type sugar transport system ATPase subunit